jgi:hypothetical protein
MSLKKLLALLVLPVAAVFVVAGCASPAPADKDDKKDTDSSKTETEEEAEEVDEAPADGELAEPGTRVGIDTWLTYSFTTTDDEEALLSARLKSVEPVSAAQLEFLNTTFDEGQLKGFDVWMLLVEEKKVSGATVEFNSDYSFFDIVDADGNQVQEITVIGWDECKTPSFDEAYDTAGGTLTQCFLAASTPGGNKPAGVAYTGGYEEGNPYDSYDGKPLLFIKG